MQTACVVLHEAGEVVPDAQSEVGGALPRKHCHVLIHADCCVTHNT